MIRNSKQALAELRRVAPNCTASEFTELLKASLLSDFERTLYVLKTQKLLLKQRSTEWIASVEALLRVWLATAPLKGKQRAHLLKHLAVSKNIQSILTTVDTQASQLRIWQAESENLTRMLFDHVEQVRSRQESALK